MSQKIEIRAPEFPESVMEGTVAVWHCAVGDYFHRDQLLVDVETDKVVLEVRATMDGRLEEILHGVGDTVHSGQLLGRGAGGAAQPAASAAQQSAPAAAEEPAAVKKQTTTDSAPKRPASAKPASAPPPSAAARRLLEEHDLSAEEVPASGRGGRLTKGDVLQYIARQKQTPQPAPSKPASAEAPSGSEERPQKRAPMSRLRARIAERLLEVSRNTAMLSTFNEADMSAVRELRRSCGEAFLQRHGVKLGMMSFFVRATVCALRDFPILNASIDGDEVVYHGFFDIGVAVSTERGLVVPVLRDAERMSFAEVERGISDYAQRAREGKLNLEEIQGGTFTITNGGVFGSLLSTPMLNPPQVGILGMHAIRDRPTAVDGQVQIRPLMNLALSYDHRLVDGREAVSFLGTVKRLIEQPALLLPDLQSGGGEEA